MGLRGAHKLSLLGLRSFSKHPGCSVDKGGGRRGFAQRQGHLLGTLLITFASRRQEPQSHAKSGDGYGPWMTCAGKIERASISGSSSAVTSPHAGSAWLLFRADWGAVLWRVYQKMNGNRLLAVAAGVVFYGLLAVFPAITAFVSLYGLMADPSTIHERLSLATGVLPQGALNILNEQLTRLTSHRTSALSLGFIGGLVVALWSANAGAKAVMDALNVAYEETEQRSFVRLNLIALASRLARSSCLSWLWARWWSLRLCFRSLD
jgi:Virulence factor BrkB